MEAFRHLAAERALVSELSVDVQGPRGAADRAHLRHRREAASTAEKELERLRTRAARSRRPAPWWPRPRDVNGVKVLAHDAGEVPSADDAAHPGP